MLRLSAKCFIFSIPILSVLNLSQDYSAYSSSPVPSIREHYKYQYHLAPKGKCYCKSILWTRQILCLPCQLNPSTFTSQTLKVTWGKMFCALFYFSCFLVRLWDNRPGIVCPTHSTPFFVLLLISLRNKSKMIMEGNPFSLLPRKANWKL